MGLCPTISGNHFLSQPSQIIIHNYYSIFVQSSRARFPAGAGNFSIHHRLHTGSGAHPASYQMGTGGFFPGGKAAGSWRWPLTSI